MTKKQLLKKGLITENPVFVLLLGMCPTLGVTTSLQNALGMGISVVFVLLFSNILVSCIRKVVPDEIRIPVFIVIIATGVTILEMILNAYVPMIAAQLGIFIPLIVVNCIILGRTEANTLNPSVNPIPIPNASKIESTTGFLQAKLSARPKIMQFTTINGIKIPS